MNFKTATERDLLKQHAPMVATVASQFAESAPQVFSPDHLHGLGLIALLDAARHYPPASCVSFEAFARAEIHHALLGEMRRAITWFHGHPATETPTLAFA